MQAQTPGFQKRYKVNETAEEFLCPNQWWLGAMADNRKPDQLTSWLCRREWRWGGRGRFCPGAAGRPWPSLSLQSSQSRRDILSLEKWARELRECRGEYAGYQVLGISLGLAPSASRKVMDQDLRTPFWRGIKSSVGPCWAHFGKLSHRYTSPPPKVPFQNTVE